MSKQAKTLTAKQAVKVWLAQNDMTAGGLAKELGISQSMLSRVLSGFRAPTEEFVRDLKRKTGVDLDAYTGVEIPS